jgi:hypothetical protein
MLNAETKKQRWIKWIYSPLWIIEATKEEILRNRWNNFNKGKRLGARVENTRGRSVFERICRVIDISPCPYVHQKMDPPVDVIAKWQTMLVLHLDPFLLFLCPVSWFALGRQSTRSDCWVLWGLSSLAFTFHSFAGLGWVTIWDCTFA